jgi:hypothetical protein
MIKMKKFFIILFFLLNCTSIGYTSLNNNIKITDLIYYYKLSYTIGQKYNLNPYILVSIGYKESNLNPYVINVNKFSSPLLSKEAVTYFVNVLNYLFLSQNYSFLNSTYDFNIIEYNSKKTNKIYKLKVSTINYTEKNRQELLNILNKLNKNNKFKIIQKNYFGINSKSKQEIINTLNAFLFFTTNIDVGITQVNYKYWLKPYNINPVLLFDPNISFDISGQILNIIREKQKVKDEIELIKRYHHNSPRGQKYAKDVIAYSYKIFNQIKEYSMLY